MTGTRKRTYLDYNATAPLLPEAREALVEALGAANPSSVHAEGRHARALVEDARRAVADLVGANPGEVTFTSGATEAAATALSANWLVDGIETRHERLAVIETDHPATREGGGFAPDAIIHLPVDADGIVRMSDLDRWLGDLDGSPAILALTLANSETGVIQPIGAISQRLRGHDVRLVVDAVQMAGRLPISLEGLGADVVILSGHKLGAAPGIGALIVRATTTRPFALIRGGGQEKGRRSGTEAVPAIASLGAAARAASFALRNDRGDLLELRSKVEAELKARCPQAIILGETAERLPQTIAVATPGLRSETAQIAFDLAGFAVSAGSACSSGKIGRSHVVAAMVQSGLAVDAGEGAIRISFGRETQLPELMGFVAEYARLAERAEVTDKAA